MPKKDLEDVRAEMISNFWQSLEDKVHDAATDLGVTAKVVEKSFAKSALVVRLANRAPRPISITRAFEIPSDVELHPGKIRSILEEKAKLLKSDDAQVSCSECGLLTSYTSLVSGAGRTRFPEVNVIQRDEGFTNSTCLVGVAYAEEGIWEGHNCAKFERYRQGFDPKEHLERQDDRQW